MNKNEKKFIVDVDKIIDAHNKKNPNEKQLTRKLLAEKLGVNTQVFSDWKSEKKPTNKMVKWLIQLSEIGDCPIKDFVIEKKLTDNNK